MIQSPTIPMQAQAIIPQIPSWGWTANAMVGAVCLAIIIVGGQIIKMLANHEDRALRKIVQPVTIVWLFSPLLILVTTQVKLPADGLIGVFGAIIGLAAGIGANQLRGRSGNDKLNEGE